MANDGDRSEREEDPVAAYFENEKRRKDGMKTTKKKTIDPDEDDGVSFYLTVWHGEEGEGHFGNDGGNFVDLEEGEGNNGNDVSGAEGAFRAVGESINVDPGLGDGANVEVEDVDLHGAGGSEGVGQIPVEIIDENEEQFLVRGIKKALLMRTKCLNDGEGDEELERVRELAHKAAGRVFRKLKKRGRKKDSENENEAVEEPSELVENEGGVVGDEHDPLPP
ncbi:chromosome condensation complex condensin, subunit H [Corchorus olitorius]|uniref:Chromosome condensation complex condensin, subunit H n=1 Tax=Corchorus olitorius TaxID=93759 RepID=A0A1R3J4Q0_9ROSI|nr:chromosome condensation complex condensin, subunit H [Corchorus olitorius]